MNNDPFEQFVRLLHYSYVIDDRRIRDSVAAFRSMRAFRSEGSDEKTEFIHFLVSNGILTEWQSEKLSSGKYKGFFIGDFVFLEEVGQTDKLKTLRARNRYSGEEVLIDVQIPKVTEDTQYTVRPANAN